MKFSDYLVNFLEEKGFTHSFGITGGGAMHLNDSFGRSKKIRSIFTHHEQSASMAAESYFREVSKPSILSVTSGPGGTNSITGVTGAWIDSIPMFVISGQVETHHTINKTKTRQIGIQEINIIDLIKKITKKSFFLKNLNEIDKKLEDLYQSMLGGRPGPVWLDVPLDLQKALIKKKKFISQKKRINKNINLDNFFKLINSSKKPIILAGNGIHISKSEKEFSLFKNKLKIPIITTWNASDLINSKDKYHIGRMGIFGDRAANLAAENSDLIISLGSRMSIPIIGYKTKKFSENSQKILVDIDKHELNKNLLSNVSMKINLCLSSFFQNVNNHKKINKIKVKKKWLNLTSDWKNKFSINKEKSHIASLKKTKHINSFVFINELSKACNGNETIVTDMGTSFTCTMQTFQIKNNTSQRLYTSSGLAAMGFGLPGAIGSAIANPKKNIICITGDGGLMFNIQEFQTIKSYNLPIKIFILQNKGYLTMKLMQKKNFNLYVGSGKKTGVSFPDFKKISFSYGIKYIKLKNKNLKSQLKKIIDLKSNIIVEVEMDEFQQLVPRLQNKMLKNGDFIVPKFDDLFPHINEKKLNIERNKADNLKK
tara:strand:- start:11930 stop:13723 length:1794 start_codon:yes stop_codon:yes gene_type:complete